jgi:hypothetical protein
MLNKQVFFIFVYLLVKIIQCKTLDNITLNENDIQSLKLTIQWSNHSSNSSSSIVYFDRYFISYNNPLKCHFDCDIGCQFYSYSDENCSLYGYLHDHHDKFISNEYKKFCFRQNCNQIIENSTNTQHVVQVIPLKKYHFKIAARFERNHSWTDISSIDYEYNPQVEFIEKGEKIIGKNFSVECRLNLKTDFIKSIEWVGIQDSILTFYPLDIGHNRKKFTCQALIKLTNNENHIIVPISRDYELKLYDNFIETMVIRGIISFLLLTIIIMSFYLYK